jgi:hypothetical protein
VRDRRARRRRVPVAGICAVLTIVLSAGLLAGCFGGTIAPSGSQKTETHQLESFQGVALRCPGTLKVVPAKTASLKITADSNVIPYITSTVQGNLLVIELERSGAPVQLGPGAKIEMELHAPALTVIENSGSGSVTGGPFSGGLFNIKSSGSGDVSLGKVSVVSLGTEISGSGSVAIESGVVGALEVTVSGSGSFAGPDLESRVATVRLSGSGDAEVWATEGLDAGVSGSGSVSYWGSPRLTEDVTGSGSVKALGPKESTTGG